MDAKGRTTASMKRNKILTAALAAALLASAAMINPAWAGFNDGVAAYEAGDYKTAFNEWLPLAQANDPAAMRNIGHMYRRGLGVEQDYNKAMTWYKRAATLGFDRAQANVAGMYLAGEGVDQDYAQAASWFARAAQQGHVVSQYNLALLLENGLGVKKDEERALGWFVIAAKSGHPAAQKKAIELAAALKNKKGDDAKDIEEDAAPGTGGPLIAAAVDEESETTAGKTPETASDPATAETAAKAEAPAAEKAPDAEEAKTVETAAAEPSQGVQKKGFYEALRSLIMSPDAKDTAAAPAAPAKETPPVDSAAAAPAKDNAKDTAKEMTAAAEKPADTVTVAKAEPVIAPADGGKSEAASAPVIVPKPQAAAKPEVVAVPVKKVASAPVPPPEPKTETASLSGATGLPPGSGLSTAEKLEMADLAYTLKQYQQSLSIWAQLAEAGNAEAQYRLGGLFNAGVAVPVDRVRAYYWWDKAKANGSAEAAAALADLQQTLTYLEKRQIERVN